MILFQKSKFITLNTAFFITILLALSDTSNVFGAPKSDRFDDPNSQCWTEAVGPPGIWTTTCCWDVVEPDDPEQIEIQYCQSCNYDPSTQTHFGCGEATQPRTSTPDVGPITPFNKNNLHELQQEPNQEIHKFDGGNNADAPRVDITEQTTPGDTGSKDEGNSVKDNSSNDGDNSN